VFLNRRRFLVTEVIQTSAIDCGPASLKALLDGFHIRTSYGRLREACQTDVDGTSIDTIEVIAEQLGLDAQQILVPLDHVLLNEAATFPAIAVVRGANGTAHFVVVWRRHGPLVQVMDPARGRLWLTRQSLLDQMFVHSMQVPAAAWREWAGSNAFLLPLRRRLHDIGLTRREVTARIDHALSDSSWHGLAAVDAATRMIASLQSTGALSRSRGLTTLTALTAHADAPSRSIGEQYWSVRSTPADDVGAETLTLHGAVLVNVKGLRHDRVQSSGVEESSAASTLSPELAAALNEPATRPLRALWSALTEDGILGPAVAILALSLAVVGVVFEAVLLRSALDMGTLLHAPEQRLWAGAALVGFAAILLGLECVLASAERRLGSHLESRLRAMFLDKIPRLADAYFQSRPVADMLERSHTLHTLRTLPRLGLRFSRVGLELLVTALAIAWLNPHTATLAIVAAVAAAAIPLMAQASVSERDLRARTHTGALARFHLDALLGRTTIEAHGAVRTIEREHEGLLAEWAGAVLALQRASITTEGFQMVVGFGLVGWILLGQLGTQNSAALLLQIYWLLNLPALGYELALIAREYPAYRSTILRVLEPLGAPDFRPAQSTPEPSRLIPASTEGARIQARGVSVRSGGHSILEAVDFDIAPGTHVAIVGASGAGKSSLLGLLLGWQRPAEGDLLIDEELFTGERVDRLRRSTAWADPGVRIWNRSLLENLLYGSGNLDEVGPVLDMCGLLPVVAKLPQGLGSPLGEGGSLLSAGEAQRVRLARAMLRKNTRLVVLDEPFLGLERDRRRGLLAQARQRWEGCTLLYVTHDISETRAFDRVLVMENGRLVEDGEPLHLAQTPSTRYRRMLQTQENVMRRVVANGDWKRIRLESGRIVGDQLRANEQTA
jgi:ABC-type bacteriocin/lantibiotic exporter with double-glycine peptidase domain